jgi:NADPH:quinone reductase-like Zn-dependent oxidoreductase
MGADGHFRAETDGKTTLPLAIIEVMKMATSTMRGAALVPGASHYRLVVKEMPIPPIGEGEVLIRVHASAVNHMDVAFLHGLSNERVESLRKSLGQDVLTGIEFSGVAESGGQRIKKGMEVIGYVNIRADRRAHAQFTSVPEGALAEKPAGFTHIEAAALPGGCLTAYEALTQIAKVKQGSRALIVGAAGSVGIYSVQLARHLGCHVVAVCNPKLAAQLRAYGADEVLDYNQSIFTLPRSFDFVFDTPPTYSFKQCEPLLNDGGTYIHTLPSKDAEGFELAKTTTKHAGHMLVLAVKDDALIQVANLASRGAIKPVVDSTFELKDVAAAHDRFEVHGKLGKVIVSIP